MGRRKTTQVLLDCDLRNVGSGGEYIDQGLESSPLLADSIRVLSRLPVKMVLLPCSKLGRWVLMMLEVFIGRNTTSSFVRRQRLYKTHLVANGSPGERYSGSGYETRWEPERKKRTPTRAVTGRGVTETLASSSWSIATPPRW